MIQAENISKSFGNIRAVTRLSAQIREGEVFGLVGSNGAGKSTFLRMVSGVLKPDQGQLLVDEEPVYEQEQVKGKLFLIPDEQYFFPNSDSVEMADYYAMVYPAFDREKFYKWMERFQLDKKRKINTFSKGMKKQVSVLLGICANTKYLLCDETFDGLDPVMRQAVKSLFAEEMMNRNFTPVVASHNLRELEDICDHVGLLHKGGMLVSRDLEDMKLNIHKVQCVIREPENEEALLADLQILHMEKRGSLLVLTVRGKREEILKRVDEAAPLFREILPLTLEEIFISETEVAGYDIKNLLF